MPTTPINTYF